MSFKGLHHTESSKRKIGEANKRRIISDETRKKMSNWQKGRKLSMATRKKMSDATSGEKNPNWQGGIKKHSSGYIQIFMPSHKRADKKGYVYGHILVAEKRIGRPLRKNEIVHHINENRADNRDENLLICTKGFHKFLHYRIKEQKERSTIV